MATFDEIKQKAEGAAQTAANKAVELAEMADDWASKPHPGLDKAAETADSVAASAIDKASQGLDAAYDAIKNATEELTGKDADGDGQVGNTGAAPGEVKAGVQVAAETVAGAAGKAAGAAKGALERLTKKDIDGDGQVG